MAKAGVSSLNMALVIGCLLTTASCTRTPPEAALRQSVAELRAAIEERDAGAIRDALAGDFIGNGALDRDGARRLAAVYFMQSTSIGITLGPLDVALRDHHATVRSTAALTGGNGRLLPDNAGLYDLRSGWRLDDGEWRMTSLEWTPR
ncbi:MAG: nuclear transport factor 2 family protein [Luteimonas sp.]